MCGIAGLLDTDARSSRGELEAVARRMGDTLRHRGPDDAGVWVDPEAGVAFAHRRLSILDLSPMGHQPMLSADGRWVLTLNGEIYNYLSIRDELAQRGHAFRGHSDTEIMLAAFQEWGLDEATARFNGMFAFGLWDRRERALHLVRDRLGEKPLYYGWLGRTLAFASELRALRAHPSFCSPVSRDVLALYLRHNCVPAPHSIYEGIFKLEPASVLTVQHGTVRSERRRRYWSVVDAVAAGSQDLFTGSDEEAISLTESALRDSIRLRMHADVPVGAFLSGGVDSSLVVALMQAQSSRPVETFSIGFNESGYNEAEAAAEVARHLGTHHTETYLTSSQARATIPSLATLYDEPFADSSQLPTYLVSSMARSKVTVSLSGDGGDELFGGYARYLIGDTIWRLVGHLPTGQRRLMSAVLQSVPECTEHLTLRLLRSALPSGITVKARRGRLKRLAEMLGSSSDTDFYRDLVSLWKHPEQIVLDSNEPLSSLTKAQNLRAARPLFERMMYWDMVSYLPDDILVKLDRASMAVGLESRIPLLDHTLVELAWRLPLRLKLRNGTTKWILRQILYRHVPQELIDRPKQGFAVPISAWLRGPLREWASALLAEARLKRDGFFDARKVNEAFCDHVTRRRNLGPHLWSVLMFQSWLATQERSQLAA